MEPNKSGEVSLDIIKIERRLRRSIEMLEPLSSECCIYKVSPCLRERNKELYTPRVVSIGPYHHGKEEFELMEKHKHRYLYEFLDRVKIGVKEYLEGLKELEKCLRQSYIGINGFAREEFVVMMAVDGAFVIEYLLKCFDKSFEANDQVFDLKEHVTTDLLLLENQLPLFYFKYLYGLVMKSRNDCPCLSEIVQGYLCNATAWEWPFDHVKTAINGKMVHHLLHVLIICLVQSQVTERKEYKRVATPTIWELHQAGLKFKPSNGILEIPKIQITSDIEVIFRNMQAVEGGQVGSENFIEDYIMLIDNQKRNERNAATVKQKNFISPWIIIYVVVFLLLNIIKTICSVLQVV